MGPQSMSAELLAVIVAMVDGAPCVLTLDQPLRLPAGPLLPGHRSLQAATRAWVEEQTGRRLGFLEQLYTFADLDRADLPGRILSVSYLGLTTPSQPSALGRWLPWYELLPWEDVRTATDLIGDYIAPAVSEWVKRASGGEQVARQQRAAISFGWDDQPWQPDLVLQRYELLFEVGLLPESHDPWRLPQADTLPGRRMLGDHRRVLATGLARLRAKIQYRPVVFELMQPEFTLRQLQECVEALAGHAVHTQNFRRLVVDQERLVEETGGVDASTGGRPARQFRFRRAVLQQRQAAGTKLPTLRAR